MLKGQFDFKDMVKHLGRRSQCRKCRILPYGVHQWIGNGILPHFDPKTISLGLLEDKKLQNKGLWAIIVACSKFFGGCGGTVQSSGWCW